ncbi:MAG: hypothetical protein HC899_34565 [Leptolyngbyaceae cyanobacterium SM1_4_3]|nr:hypothetical protein [Leptolyngbyaceae cyanobacterium SM1_4_3]
MSVNKYLPHILVLPEDEADSDIANGFLLHPQLNARSIQVLPYVGGWKVVVEKFITNFIPTMRQYPNRWFVLLIDFDREEDRLDYIKQQIPDDVKDRVFVLGALSNPEELRSSLEKSLEAIGESLSANCSDNTDGLWGHDLLRHNKTELERMISSVKPFLFNQAR